MKTKLIEIYKGYRIKDYSKQYGENSYSVPGCIWIYGTIGTLKKYIDEHDNINPTETGTMVYGPKTIID